jgi:hypothetical protein
MSLQSKILLPVVFILNGFLNFDLIYSQILINQPDSRERIFLVSTKQFNEFIDRFNYKVNLKGEPIDSLFKSKISREKLIYSLFDLKDPRTDPSGPEYSEIYVKEKAEFVQEVLHKNLAINKYSDNIIAEAKSRIVFRGVNKTLQLFLSQEILDNDKVKWVIITAASDIFNFFHTDTSFVRSIPPSSNETDFINLRRALADTDHLQYYASKDYNPDYLTLFFYMINTGMIRFEYVEEVVYHIIDIPGWYIKVKGFNRPEMNSGWLITDLGRNSDNKLNYLKALKD